MIRPPPTSTLFPYTTLFRSRTIRTSSSSGSRRPRSRRCTRSWSRSSSPRSEEHTSELQSPDHLVCRLLIEKKNLLFAHCLHLAPSAHFYHLVPSSPHWSVDA